MCGIVGLFAKSRDRGASRRAPRRDARPDVEPRPDSAGVAVYRDPAPSGSSKLTLYSADPHERWGAVRDGLCDAFGTCASRACARATPSSSSTPTRRCRAVGARQPAGPPVMSAGRVIEIYKETGLPEEFARAFALEDFRGRTRSAHADGHREPRDDRGLAPVLDGLRPLPRPQRIVVQPQPLREQTSGARASSPDGDDTEGAAGLPFAWRLREGAASSRRSRGCLDDLDGFYTFARRTADGFASSAPRSPASRGAPPRRTTGSRWRPSGARSPCCPRAPTRGVGAGARRRYAWEKASSMAVAERGTRQSCRSRVDLASAS
jgi:hypothetical protein